jgi:predicted anti-sigma-YlaC factor YlaD
MSSKPLWQTLLELAVEQQHILSCEECYNLMDQYTDLLRQGMASSEAMLLVKEHLDCCYGCEEMFAALAVMVEKAESAEETNQP